MKTLRPRVESMEPRLVLSANPVVSLEYVSQMTEPAIVEMATEATLQDSTPGSTGLQLGGLPGDFNGDDAYTAADINMLAEGIHSGSTDSVWDLNADLNVDMDDMNMLIHDLIRTEYGDADLDFDVDGDDFAVWNSHSFTATAGWENGDFTGDGMVDGYDFLRWNFNKVVPQSGQTSGDHGSRESQHLTSQEDASAKTANPTIAQSPHRNELRERSVRRHNLFAAEPSIVDQAFAERE